nr:MAG TPA: hypothetical protein [Caudoviricetes sp.]
MIRMQESLRTRHNLMKRSIMHIQEEQKKLNILIQAVK